MHHFLKLIKFTQYIIHYPGIVLLSIPEPTAATKVAGYILLTHGAANFTAATTSTVVYEVSNGNRELSTSAAGITTQKIIETNLKKQGDPEAVTKAGLLEV
jgi:hypothetical protein